MTRYAPWIVSEHVPDLSSLDRLVADPHFAGKTGADLAVALWRLMVDRDLGIFHYCPAQEPFWGRDVFDPLQVLNVYGFAICHIHAHVLAILFRAAGFASRIANIRGHEGTEVFYDDRWHYFDADIQMFHRLRPPNEHIIASRQDTYEDPTLVSDQPNPSFPYHIPDRLPERFAELYKVEPSYPDVLEERLHGMDFRLRPGEEMTCYFHHRGRWVVFENYPAMFTRYRSETGPEGPTERFWPRRQWGNGSFHYAPDLTDGSRDAECGADAMAGLAPAAGGLTCQAESGSAVFAFESPYVYCGIPDPLRRVPAAEGTTVAAAFDLPEGAAAGIDFAPERGETWETIWRSHGRTGEVACAADFTERAEGRYRFRLRFRLEGEGAALKSLETRLWFMVSPHSLPALRRAGENRMRLHSGDRHGLPTRPLLIQHRTDEADWAETAFATENLRHDPTSWARLTPAEADRPWRVVYELAAPEGGTMAWAAAYAIVEGRKPDEPHDGTPATIELADSPEGPWRTAAEREIVIDPNGWHFGVFGEGRFAGDSAPGYVRFSAGKGANGFRVMGHYIDPAADGAPDVPLEIEHAWYEVHEDVGRRLHTHVERIAPGADDAEYVVRCDREPHDERITLRAPSTRSES